MRFRAISSRSEREEVSKWWKKVDIVGTSLNGSLAAVDIRTGEGKVAIVGGYTAVKAH
jgi:hypothetical protein